MDPYSPRVRKGPEAKIQLAIIKMLEDRNWLVIETHGNAYQKGVPDLWACNVTHGPRWIEVKNPVAYSFTPAQRMQFPKYAAFGAGIWILTAATTHEYLKLMAKPNWHLFLKLHHGVRTWDH